VERDVALFEQAEHDLHAIGGDGWAGRIRSYQKRARQARELAFWVADERGARSANDQRRVPLDERGTFPGRWLP
jgi:hypothetical protein